MAASHVLVEASYGYEAAHFSVEGLITLCVYKAGYIVINLGNSPDVVVLIGIIGQILCLAARRENVHEVALYYWLVPKAHVLGFGLFVYESQSARTQVAREVAPKLGA